MAKLTARPFTLLDAMILLAAMAVGLAMTRHILICLIFDFDPVWPQAVQDGIPPLPDLLIGSSPCAACWSVTLAALGLRLPRPRRKRLLQCPGRSACISTALIATLSAPPVAVTWVVRQDEMFWRCPSFTIATLSTLEFGSGIAAIWFLLAASGYWRAEPTWIDRVGRLLGVYWLVMIPIAIWAYLG